MKKHKLRRMTALILAFVLAVSLGITGAVAANGTEDITYTVGYRQDLARESLEYVNSFRTSDTWYWNSDNTTKTSVSGLNALEYDYSLEEAAMQRAAEIAVYFSHTRPNGSSWSTAVQDSGYTYVYAGENLAAGSASYCGTAQNTIKLLEEENENYAGQGHRRNMLGTNYTAYAMGCVYVNNTYYWAMVLAAPKTDIDINQTTAKTGDSRVSVSVKNDLLNFGSTDFHDTPMNAGDTQSLPSLDLYITPSFAAMSSAKISVSVSGSAVWASSDESVAEISGNKITAKSPGTAVISATVGDITVSFNVTVESDMTVTYCEAEPSTCVSNGHDEYWYVEETDQYFTDEALTHEVQWDDLVLPLGDHDYSDLSLAYTQWKTCEDEGYIFHVCKYCGNEVISQILAPEGHLYVGLDSNFLYNKIFKLSSPTCTEDGTCLYFCVRGDTTYPDGTPLYNCSNCITVTIPATGHDWGGWHDNGDGTQTRACSVCGETETAGTADECSHSGITVDSFVWTRSENKEDDGIGLNSCVTNTQTDEGSIQMFSVYDDEEEPEPTSLETLESYIEYAKGLDSTDYTSKSWENMMAVLEKAESVANDKNASETEIIAAANDLADAINGLVSVWNVKTGAGTYSCIAERICEECGYSDTVTCKVSAGNTTATCEEDGTMGLIAECGDYQDILTVNVPAAGHTWEAVSETPATCSAPGTTTYTCVECGAAKTEQTPGSEPTNDHAWTVSAKDFDWDPDDPFTCHATIHCADCGKTDTVKCDVDVEEVIGTDDCTENGTVIYCASVNYGGNIYSSTKTVESKAGSHEWNDGIIIDEPTDVEKGVIEYTCVVCGATYDDFVQALGTEEHSWEAEFSWSDDYAECTATFTCTECDAVSGPYACIIAKNVISEPSEEQDGITECTAVCEFDGETYTSEPVEVTVPYAPEPAEPNPDDQEPGPEEEPDPEEEHFWTADMAWAENTPECEITFTCGDCGFVYGPYECVITRDAELDYEENDVLYLGYTASFTAENGEEFEDHNIYAHEHSWRYEFSWSENEPACEITFTCAGCEAGYGPYECEVMRDESLDVEATYEHGAMEAYTAEFTTESGSTISDTAMYEIDGSILIHDADITESLEKDIAEAESLDGSGYTEDTWAVLEDALAGAKDVLENENSTDEERAEALSGLSDAINGLVTLSYQNARDELESLYEEGVMLASDEYRSAFTDDSVLDLDNALIYANAVLNNPDSTEEDIQNAVDVLKAAIDSLEPVSSDEGTSSTGTDSDTGSDDTGNEDKGAGTESGSSDESGTAGETSSDTGTVDNGGKSSETSTVKTGDIIMWSAIGVIVIAAVAVAVVMITRNKNNKKEES